jgi:hypothetical protein
MGSDGSTIVVSAETVDDRKPLESLGVTILGVAQEYEGIVISQSDVLSNGWPGIEAAIRSKGLPTYRVRAFRVNQWMFSVGVGSNDRTFAEKTFQSISFAPRFGAGGWKSIGPEWTRSTLKPYASTAEFPAAVTSLDNALPGFVGPLRVFISDYGNRRYTATSATLRDEAIATEEDIKNGIRKVGLGAISSAKAKFVRRTESSLDGLASERVEATLLESNVTMLIDATVMGNQLIVLGVTVPTALKDSPEVAHFFSSFKSK